MAAGAAAYTELKNICVWAKNNGGMGSLYRSQHEFVFVFKSGTAPHVIAAIECLYYLSPDEQVKFFRKLLGEHKGTFIMSAPIIGANEHRTYFTHSGLLSTFVRHGLSMVEWGNLNAHWKVGVGGFAAAVAARLSDQMLAWVPERFVYQRCYDPEVRHDRPIV
jgi:hypothetical protein